MYTQFLYEMKEEGIGSDSRFLHNFTVECKINRLRCFEPAR